MPGSLINSISVCPDPDKVYDRIVSGKGVYLYDESGKEYLDAVGGKAALTNIGHGNEEMAAHIASQIGLVTSIPTYCFTAEALEEYLDKLIGFSPEGFTKAWLVTSGSEAVENACKLAYQYHKIKGDNNRVKIISRRGSYHGNSILGLDIGGVKYRSDYFAPMLKGYPKIPSNNCYRCPLKQDKNNCRLECADELEKTILEEGPDTISAFIFEPVVGAALGAVVPKDGYLEKIRNICDKYGVLMIADEVMTGFGRTGYNFAVSRWNITPDIIVGGKGMGSGYYPISAIIASRKVMLPFEQTKTPFGGMYSYACNLLAAHVGNKVIDIMTKQRLPENAQKMGQLLGARLQELREYSIVGDIRGMGLLYAVEFVEDAQTSAPFDPALRVSHRITEMALDKGLIVYPCKGSYDGIAGDHILLTPPLLINEVQVNTLVDILHEVLTSFRG